MIGHGKCPGEIISEYMRMACGGAEHCTFSIVGFFRLGITCHPLLGEVVYSEHGA